MKPNRLNHFCIKQLLAVTGLFAMSVCAHAASGTWLNSGVTDGNWNTATNWAGGTIPGSTAVTTNTDVATFNTAVGTFGTSGSPVIIDSATQNIGGISFGTAAGNYFIGTTGGNALKLTSGGTIQIPNTLSSTNAVGTINANLSIQAANGTYTFANNSANGTGAGAGTLSFGGALSGAVAGATVLNLNGTNTNANTIGGNISNGTATSLAITKTGAGTWVLSGTNSYSGLTTINGGTLTTSGTNSSSGATLLTSGTLSLNNATNGGLASGTLTLNGGTIQNTTGGSVTIANPLSAGPPFNGPAVTFGGSQAMIFSNSFAPFVQNGSSFYNPIFTVNNSALTTFGTLGSTTLGITSVGDGGGRTLTFNGTGNALVNSAIVNGGLVACNFTKAGGGTLTLAGVNTYTGATTLQNGTLVLSGGDNRLNSATALTLGDVSNNAGKLVLGAGATKSDLTVASLATTGTGASSVVGGASVVSALTVNQAGNTTFAGLLGGGGANENNLSLTKTGAGVLTLSGANSYTGLTTINGGTLTTSGTNSSSGATNLTSGTLSLNNATNGGLASGTLTLNGGTIQNTTGGSVTIANLLSAGPPFNGPAVTFGGSQAMIFSNSFTPFVQTGSSFYNPIFTVNNSALTTFGTLGSTTLGITSVGDGGARLLTFNGTGNALVNSAIVNGGLVACNLTKAGGGTLTLAGANTYTGTTTVNGGTLIINGASSNSAVTVASGGTLAGAGSIAKPVTVNSGGFLAPGSAAGSSIGTLTVTGSNTLTLAAGSKTTCEIQKSGVTLTNDQLLTNAVVYGGTLEVTASGDALAAGDEFFLFTFTSRSGSFGTITLPTLSSGLVWDLSKLSVNGSIKVTDLAMTPIFDLAEGNYIGAQNVTMTSESGSTVYYTFAMGSVPADPTTSSASGTAGSGTATVNLPTNGVWTVKAMAAKPGFGNSVVAIATYHLISTPTWINPSGGYWGFFDEDKVNWQDEVVAEGSGIPADFSTLALGSDTTVTLDGNRTIGSLIFGDTGNQFDWILDKTLSSTLTLAGPTPSIAVNNQSATVLTPLAGTGGLVKTGAGDLILVGSAGYTGNTAISQGSLTFKAPSNATWALGGGTKTIASSAVMKADFSTQTVSTDNNSLGAIAINGTLNLSGTSGVITHVIKTITLSGAGNINITDDEFTINSNAALNNFTGAINVNGTSRFTYQGATTSTTGTYAVNVASGATFDIRTEGPTMGALNGSGSVIKSFNGFTGTLTIGNGNGNGDFSGAMSAQPTTYNLVKTGSGTQILSGVLSYPGTTTVNGGKLVINGASTGSNFTVATTSTLGGSGSIGGTVTVNTGGTLAPGNSIGTLTLATATLNGTYQCDLGAVTSDKVVVTGTLTVGGTTNITFTGSPMASSYIIASYDTLTGTLPAITPPTGYNLVNDTTAKQIKLVKVTGYGSWMDAWVSSGFTGDAAVGADADNDGMKNLMEYVLNGNPGASDLTLLPQLQVTATDFVFTFTRRADSATDTTQVFEYGSDLAGWTSLNITGTPDAGVAVGAATGTAPNEVQTVTITIPRTAAVNGTLFGRLQVTSP